MPCWILKRKNEGFSRFSWNDTDVSVFLYLWLVFFLLFISNWLLFSPCKRKLDIWLTSLLIFLFLLNLSLHSSFHLKHCIIPWWIWSFLSFRNSDTVCPPHWLIFQSSPSQAIKPLTRRGLLSEKQYEKKKKNIIKER